MHIVTARQMATIDERCESEFGVTTSTLMDNAGQAVATALMRLYPELAVRNLVILCGKGNNGGDGIAAARHLKTRGIPARVVLLAGEKPKAGPAAAQRQRASQDGIVIEEITSEAAWSEVAASLPHHGLILDALLGTGLTGPARGLSARAIDDVNGSGVEVIALDIPSGLSGDTAAIPGPAVHASQTIALACPKIPHVFGPGASLVGRLHVAEIGIPREAMESPELWLNLIDESDVAPLVPVRELDSHKGEYGRVLVVGGSLPKSGAAALTCHAALRSGAGLVTAATSRSAQPILAGHLMEMMTEGLAETPAGALSHAALAELTRLAGASDLLAVGPGLTDDPETAALVRELIRSTSLPIVLDADGINAYAGRAAELGGDSRVLILTPHPGEMARLLSREGSPVTTAQVQADRVGTARSFAIEHACYLVLKGHKTVVAGPDGEVWVNDTGNPGMATAGSGDVLTGVLAALLGAGLSPLAACIVGVHAHGLAGDLAAAEYGETSLVARDIIEYLPDAFGQLERAAQE